MYDAEACCSHVACLQAPEWGEEFECLIHDLSTEELKISVRDQNEASLGLPATSLGECTVGLDQLRGKHDVTVWIPHNKYVHSKQQKHREAHTMARSTRQLADLGCDR